MKKLKIIGYDTSKKSMIRKAIRKYKKNKDSGNITLYFSKGILTGIEEKIYHGS